MRTLELPVVKYQIYITYEETSSGGQICAGQENDSWPSYEPEYREVELKELILAKEYPIDSASIEVDFNPEKYIGKPLYIVFVKYQTGSTFGHSCGNPCFPECCKTKKEAEAFRSQISEGKYKGYAPWIGYFERLESVEVEEMVLKDKRKTL